MRMCIHQVVIKPSGEAPLICLRLAQIQPSAGLPAGVLGTVTGRSVERLDAGQVAVNLPTGWDVHHPFGGFRDSGSPFKEQRTSGLRLCARIKTAAVRHRW
jgi:acyl-CoA reductase-like NAD-dependent aldehyde dehydrogenase